MELKRQDRNPALWRRSPHPFLWTRGMFTYSKNKTGRALTLRMAEEPEWVLTGTEIHTGWRTTVPIHFSPSVFYDSTSQLSSIYLGSWRIRSNDSGLKRRLLWCELAQKGFPGGGLNYLGCSFKMQTPYITNIGPEYLKKSYKSLRKRQTIQ